MLQVWRASPPLPRGVHSLLRLLLWHGGQGELPCFCVLEQTLPSEPLNPHAFRAPPEGSTVWVVILTSVWLNPLPSSPLFGTAGRLVIVPDNFLVVVLPHPLAGDTPLPTGVGFLRACDIYRNHPFSGYLCSSAFMVHFALAQITYFVKC